MKSCLAITKALMLSLMRDRETLFFSLLLPLIFLLIFGPMFAGSGGGGKVEVAVYTTAPQEDQELLAEIFREMSGLEAAYVDSLQEVSRRVAHQQADFGLAWGGSILAVFLNPARLQDNAIYNQLSEGIRTELDRRRLGVRDFFHVELIESGPQGQLGGELGYVFPGVIALGVMSAGLFLMPSSFLNLKERFVLKRFAATPMVKLHLLVGLMATRMVLSAISAVLVLIVGRQVLGVSLPANWLLFAFYLVAATVIMSGAGAVIALLAGNARSASNVAGLAMTIMMFFSGVYFPIEFLPRYLRGASLVLPATYVAKGFRFVLGLEPMPILSFFRQTLVLASISLAAVWMVAMKGSWDAS